MTKMDPEWKEKWIAALRSGEFTQARDVLREEEGCGCCLYVLTELVRRENPDVGKWPDDGDFLYETDEGIKKEAGGDLAPTIQAITGLRDSNPVIGESFAIDLNDNQKLSFTQIADLIEQHL